MSDSTVTVTLVDHKMVEYVELYIPGNNHAERSSWQTNGRTLAKLAEEYDAFAMRLYVQVEGRLQVETTEKRPPNGANFKVWTARFVSSKDYSNNREYYIHGKFYTLEEMLSAFPKQGRQIALWDDD